MRGNLIEQGGIASLRPEHHAVQGFVRNDYFLNRDLGRILSFPFAEKPVIIPTDKVSAPFGETGNPRRVDRG